MTRPTDAVTVVIPVHNAADRMDRVIGWRMSLEKSGRGFEILMLTTAALTTVLRGSPASAYAFFAMKPSGASALSANGARRSASALLYTAPIIPTLRPISARCSNGSTSATRYSEAARSHQWMSHRVGDSELVAWSGRAWRLLGRVFAGMPMNEPPWHGWPAYRHRVRSKWVYGVPLADVNSCSSSSAPHSSSGSNSVRRRLRPHELVAKATFLPRSWTKCR